MVSNVFQIFTQIPEEILSNLTGIYLKRGWNHQLVKPLKRIKCSKKLVLFGHCAILMGWFNHNSLITAGYKTDQASSVETCKDCGVASFWGVFYFFCGLVQRKNKKQQIRCLLSFSGWRLGGNDTFHRVPRWVFRGPLRKQPTKKTRKHQNITVSRRKSEGTSKPRRRLAAWLSDKYEQHQQQPTTMRK